MRTSRSRQSLRPIVIAALVAASTASAAAASPPQIKIPEGQPNETGAYEAPCRYMCSFPHGGGPGSSDTDRDGLTDYAESQGRSMGRSRPRFPATDPRDADTDNDGLSDGYEFKRTYAYNRHGNKLIDHTSPTSRDSDGDGLADGYEVKTWKTNPVKADTDGDGLRDKDERRRQTDPRSRDTDRDGLTDGYEVNASRTNPRSRDTDSDGLFDGEEITKWDTSPHDTDSDDDTLTDGDEALRHGTNPRSADVDQDCGNDPTELARGTNPHRPDGDYCPTPAQAPTPAPGPAPGPAPTPDSTIVDYSSMDYGSGVLRTCTTAQRTGVQGRNGAWGHDVGGCRVELTCPVGTSVCTAKSEGAINTEEYVGHRVTLRSTMEALSASKSSFWSRFKNCDNTDWCRTEDAVNIRGGETAAVECSGVRQSAATPNRAKVTCSLDVQKLY